MRLLAALSLACALSLHAQTPTPPPASDHMAAKPPAPPSHSLNVTYAGHSTLLSVEDLLNLPQTTVHVHNTHTNADETYTGPLVADVLAHIGLTPTKEHDELILHSVVVATATDRYFAVFSAAELEPAFTKSQVIVALMKSGLPNTAGDNLQLINTDAAKPARWVHGLLDLNVLTLAAKFNPPPTTPTTPPTP